MSQVVVAGACRTAIGRLGGALSGLTAVELGEVVVREAVSRAGLRGEDIEEAILGQVLQAGSGPNTARQAALKAGIPIGRPAYTVNMVCASGMKAVALGAAAIASGEREAVVVGGVESMSGAPYLLDRARSGYRLGDGTLEDVILKDALNDPMLGCHMGVTAENLAREYGITREAQDAFAAASQAKAGAALEAGRFEDEIVPVMLPQRKGDPVAFERDEHPRPDVTAEGLAALRPAFEKDGTVTAGNASGINDGAAAMVLVSESFAEKRGVVGLGRIVATGSAGVEPERMGMGPVPATRIALERAGIDLGGVDVVELNEAFAAQSLAVIKELGLAPEKVNPRGGAIALGHPVGCSGARILVTLLHTLRSEGLATGLATLCVGGGQGMAVVAAVE